MIISHFKFCRSNLNFLSKNDTTELFFDEHVQEIRQRFFHTLIFLTALIILAFFDIKVIVKLLEMPVQHVKFFQLSPGEYFISTVKIAFYTGLLFATPIVLSQIAFFILPGLNGGEKKIIVGLLSSSGILFIIGLSFSYFVLIPAALQFFINYSSEVIEPLLSFDQYFSFISILFFSTGLVFQIPILQIILCVSGIVTAKKMLFVWRYVLIFSTILGAVLTPSADPLTQLLLSSALFFLYLGGSVIAGFITNPRSI
jgi:sec-independent protein translocase protein TatC